MGARTTRDKGKQNRAGFEVT